MTEMEKSAEPVRIAGKVPWQRSWTLAFGAVGGFLLLMYLVAGGDDSSTPSPAPAERTVSRADVQPWPFTVDSGVLRCRTHSGVTFQPTGGTEYGLNGSAKTIGYGDPDSIWADDPALGNGLKVSMAGAIAAGQALC